MRLETSEPDIFVGLHTYWLDRGLVCQAKFNDPWGVSFYNLKDSSPLKPWCSWAPPCQRPATMRGIFARCFYLSSSPDAFTLALLDAFASLIKLADYPHEVVFNSALVWAKTWQPKKLGGLPLHFALNAGIVERAIQRYKAADRD